MSNDPQFVRWFTVDLPVLRAIVELSNEGEQYIRRELIVERAGLDDTTVANSLLALANEDPPLFEAPGAHSGMNRQVSTVHSVTGHAQRTAGAWPTKEALSAALVEEIARGLDEAAQFEDDAEERGKIRRTASWLGGAGKDVFTDVVATVITKQMGM